MKIMNETKKQENWMTPLGYPYAEYMLGLLCIRVNNNKWNENSKLCLHQILDFSCDSVIWSAHAHSIERKFV